LGDLGFIIDVVHPELDFVPDASCFDQRLADGLVIKSVVALKTILAMG
jgi:hypothetical protein